MSFMQIKGSYETSLGTARGGGTGFIGRRFRELLDGRWLLWWWNLRTELTWQLSRFFFTPPLL
jgi:hypothetical protein